MQAEEPHGPICEIARQQKCKDFSRPENIPATNIKKGVENVFLASVTFFAEQYTLKAFLYACSSGVTIFISQCESLLLWRNDLNFRHFSLDALGAVLKICNLEKALSEISLQRDLLFKSSACAN